MGSGSSFFSRSTNRPSPAIIQEVAINSESNQINLSNNINTLNSPQVYNHVVSTSDGRISSQRLRIETPRQVAEFRETSRTDGVIMTSGKFTPRQAANEFELENEHKLSIPYTPNGEEANAYKYYCPLCMQYYKFMWKSACCSNYICLPCTQDYLKGKGVTFSLHIESHKMDHVYCPHCQTKGFKPVVVEDQESVRDYRYSYEPISSSVMPSPLKIGESFEDLKRKMIPFKVLSSVPSGSISVHASPVLQVVSSETPGQCDTNDPQAAIMRGIAIPDDDDVVPPSPSIARNTASLFGETPRNRSSPPRNPDSGATPRSPRYTPTTLNGEDEKVMDTADLFQSEDGGIERITSSISVQATPLFKAAHSRPDEDLLEASLEDSIESLVFPRLQDEVIRSPTSIISTSPECTSKVPRTLATDLVNIAINTACHHHKQMAQ